MTEVMNDDKENIIDTIIKLMEQTESFLDKDGAEKKVYVLSGLKIIIGAEVYHRYHYFISMFIDFAVSISKGRKLNLNNIKKNCCFELF